MAEFIRKRNDWENDKRSTSELAAVDTVSSATYLNLKFKAILAYIRSSTNPIGEVLHYCYSVESQGRGMLHWHCKIWVKNAPIYEISPNQEIADLILRYITCRIPNKKVSQELYRRVISYQQHEDNSYCMRQVKGSSDDGVKKLKNI